MKKYFLMGLIVAITPSICFGASARYTQLVREKQRKMAELEKCMGATNGLKIAGLSTLGLTAVGVAGNVAEAQKIKELDDYIEKAPEVLAEKEAAIAKLAEHEETDEKSFSYYENQEKLEDKEYESAFYKARCRLSGGFLKDGTCLCSENKKADSNGKCVSPDEDTDETQQ